MTGLNKLLGALGLALKAGALVCGTNNVLDAVRNGQAKLVLLANDISDNTRKLLTDKATYRNIRIVALPLSMAELGAAFGKAETSSAAITDNNFVVLAEKHLPGQIPNNEMKVPETNEHGGNE